MNRRGRFIQKHRKNPESSNKNLPFNEFIPVNEPIWSIFSIGGGIISVGVGRFLLDDFGVSYG
jgi:hypothetical protein